MASPFNILKGPEGVNGLKGLGIIKQIMKMGMGFGQKNRQRKGSKQNVGWKLGFNLKSSGLITLAVYSTLRVID